MTVIKVGATYLNFLQLSTS